MKTSRRLFPLCLGLAAPLLFAQVPRPSPDFTFKLPDGRQIKESQYRGKVVALCFLSTT